MRNFTRLTAMLCMGACLSTMSATAEETIEPGTSCTDKINNPNFDAGNSNGWNLISSSKGGFGNGIMEIFNAAFDLNQTIKGLIPGTYKLTADGFHRWGDNDSGVAHKGGTEVINTALYAKTALKEKQTPLHSLYKIEGLVAPEEGWTPNLNGYVNNVSAAAWAFGQGYYLDNTINNIVVGTDSILTIGIKTLKSNVTNSWTIYDNFTLTYVGPAGLTAYYEIMDDLENSLSEYSETNLPSGALKEVELVLEYKNANSDNADTKELQAVIDSMTHVLALAVKTEPYMAELSNLHGTVAGFISLGYDGGDALETVADHVLELMSYGATKDDGSLVFTEDLQAAKIELERAIRKYRFNESITNATEGIDVTWAVYSPNFTKTDGDPSNNKDAEAKNWIVDNTRTRPADNYDCRTNTVSGKNCWNNWSNGECDAMNVYQEYDDMRPGIYTFSLITTNDGAEITDQHAYATTVAGTFDSPIATYTYAKDENPDKVNFATSAQWEPLAINKILVGSDGKLRVGMRSTMYAGATSGWFCFTDCHLQYHGMPDGAYAETMQNLIAKAEELSNSEMLYVDNKALTDAIAIAKKVDTSNNPAVEAGMTSLNEAMTTATQAIKALATFKVGPYAKAITITENVDGTYSEEIQDLISNVILSQNEILEKDTTTMATYPSLNAELNQYLSFVDAYQECVNFAGNLIDDKTPLLISACLSAQVAKVKADPKQMNQAKATYTAMMSFVSTYLLAMQYAFDETYPPEMTTELAITTEAQFANVEADHSKSTEAEKVLFAALAKIRLLGLEAGENTEITSSVITNPDIEILGANDIPEGWMIKKNTGGYTNTSQHWSGMSSDRYIDSWDGTPGKLAYTAKQEIKGIPNGTYRLVVATRASGNGSYAYINVNDGMMMVEIPWNNADHGNIWEAAEEGSDVKLANNGIGFGWNWIEIPGINVNTNTITIGCSTDSTVTGKPWTGTWFSADNFKLYWTSTDYSVDIENVNADPTTKLIAYAKNGYIIVEGVEEYTITALSGMSVKPNKQLVPGIYIVKAGTKTAKIIVK